MSPSVTIERLLRSPAAPDGPGRPLDDPRREMAAGALVAAALVLGCGGWALTARLDAAVTGPGVVRPSPTRQEVQSPAAGIVSSVLVSNGERVRRGQILVRLSDTEAAAQERSIAARVVALHAEIARIEAELTGAAQVEAPAEFAALAGEDRRAADAALATERAQLAATRSLDRAQAAVIDDRTRQIGQQIAGQSERLASAERQKRFGREELALYQQLLDRGLATRPHVLALQRQAAGLEGDAGSSAAEMARLRTEIGNARLQLVQVRSERAARNADRLHAAQTELAALAPQWTAARVALGRSVVRAPFDGTISAAQMPTREMVLQQGAKLVEIVPSAGTLMVDMRVPLSEAVELRSGQAAQVRLSGAGGRLLPTLGGRVERVSADSVQDERSGQSFYIASIRVAPSEMVRLAKLGAMAGGIRAGTPVEVTVPTHARSAFGYLVGPLAARTGDAFSQR